MDDAFDDDRRRFLARLGLAAGAVYVAPVLLGLSGARASSASFSSVRRRPVRRQRPRREPARPEIVVSATSDADIDAIAAQGFTLLSRDTIGLTGRSIARFRAPANLTISQAQARVQELVPTAVSDLNSLYRPGSLDCEDGECAAFDMIGWKTQSIGCAAGITVGMIDTSVNAEHAALAGIDLEIIPVTTQGRRSSSSVHGTSIAILLAGRSDARTPGLLGGVKLVAVEGFHRDAGGQDVADAYDIARSLDRIGASGARIVNLSFTGADNAVLAETVRALLDRDVILVAAAGNQGPDAKPLYPAAYDGVVAVTAVDRDRKVYRQANSGAHIDFAAPGVRLWTAASVSGGRFRSGTSYAAPFVTAALAAARSTNPAEPAASLVERLASTAQDLGPQGRDPTFGWGLVQSDGICSAPGLLPASATGG